MASVYPSTLPAPAVATLSPAEQRQVSKLDGPRITRAAQRDRLGVVSLRFPPMTFTEAAAFFAWGQSDLTRWQEWFSASWPLPQGGVGVFRFLAPPQRSLVAGVGWQISATAEVRGASLIPADCYDEDFNLAAYTTVTGANLFSVGTGAAAGYGPSIFIAAQNSAAIAQIVRPIPQRAMSTLSAKFMVSTANPDDAAVLRLFLNGLLLVSIEPLREAALDASRRVMVDIGTGYFPITSGQVTVGVWYRVDVRIASGAGASYAVVSTAADGLVLGQAFFAAAFTPIAVNQLGFFADSTGLTCPTTWADIHICS